MSWVPDRPYYQRLASSEDGAARVVVKEGWFWHLLGYLLHGVTFGAMSHRTFMERYATTVGPLQAYPRGWPRLRDSMIVHESRHTKQARWHGLWTHPWVGLPLFAISYLLLPLPAGLAWLRYKFELDADRAGFSYAVRNRQDHGRSLQALLKRAHQRADQLSGPQYGWAWPRRWARSGYEKMALEVWRKETVIR